SHNLQCRLRAVQTLLGLLELAAQPGNLSLILARLPDRLTGLLSLEDTRIAQSAPFGDQRGIQTLTTQVSPSLLLPGGVFVRCQVFESLVGGESATAWTTSARARRVHGSIIADRS